jgi:hypothetical protein
VAHNWTHESWYLFFFKSTNLYALLNSGPRLDIRLEPSSETRMRVVGIFADCSDGLAVDLEI